MTKQRGPRTGGGWRTFTNAELRKFATDQASRLRYINPRKVDEGKMSRARAERECRMMEEIAELLKDQQRLL
jgi:hypothetical protein